MKQTAVVAVAAAAVLAAAIWASPAQAQGPDCNARRLARTDVLICGDPQLLRTNWQLARRADAIARRMNFGQYLGLRHWEATSAQQRRQCADRACVKAHFGAQARLLDRLQQCLESRLARRACLREALSLEREASGAAGRRGAAGTP